MVIQVWMLRILFGLVVVGVVILVYRAVSLVLRMLKVDKPL